MLGQPNYERLKAGKSKVAVFDFDETLTERNTLIQYSEELVGDLKTSKYIVGSALLAIPHYLFSKERNQNTCIISEQKFFSKIKSQIKDSGRKAFLSFLRKSATPELEREAAKMSFEKIAYIDSVVTRLQKHIDDPDCQVWIVTGSSKHYVKEIARLKGWSIDNVIGTNFYGGESIGKEECIRKNKYNILKKALDEAELYIDAAYGNFPDDLHMLGMSLGEEFTVTKGVIYNSTPIL